MATLARMKTGTGYQLSIEQDDPGDTVKLVGWDGTTSQELVSMSEASFVVFEAAMDFAVANLMARNGGRYDRGEAAQLGGLR